MVETINISHGSDSALQSVDIEMSNNTNHDHHGNNPHSGTLTDLLICACGMVGSLALYGVALEYATSNGNKLHELSFIFVTTTIYTITAHIASVTNKEEPTNIKKHEMLTLSFTSLASTYTSVRSLRYVIYPVQVLFKSCKPVPVMAFGVLLGKKYPLKKYVNVILITSGVALFMGGGSSVKKDSDGDSFAGSTFLGVLMLTLSLCFDGATGAYEDKLMANDHVEPFDLMYNIQFGKSVISFCLLVATNQLHEFVQAIHLGFGTLLLLGFTGALGQIFVFFTISKFGALNCALIGLGRKMLTLALSFSLYGHTMNGIQILGLSISVASMIANFMDKGGSTQIYEYFNKFLIFKHFTKLISLGGIGSDFYKNNTITRTRPMFDSGTSEDDEHEEESSNLLKGRDVQSAPKTINIPLEDLLMSTPSTTPNQPEQKI